MQTKALSQSWVVLVSLFLGCPAVRSQIVIGEFMAVNDTTLTDEDGDTSDWIELHNSAATNVDLAGWYLTDRSNDLAKWSFPATHLSPGAYLVVFASGKDRSVSGCELHTGFKLSGDGEYLSLVWPDGQTVEHEYAPAYPTQYADVSYGSTFGYMGTPTPGAPNSTGFAGYVADTKFSVDRGFYTEPIRVAITTLTENASIYYTTDCSVPSTSNGALYTTAIPITNTTVLRAAAFRPGYKATDVDTHTYVFPADVLAQTGDGFPVPPNPSESDWTYEMDPDIVQDSRFAGTLTNDLQALPVLSFSLPADELWGVDGIYANPESLGEAWERSASMELFSVGDDGTQVNCGLRVQGGGSRYRNVGKKSLRVAFRSEYGPTRLRYPFFDGRGAGEYDTITIRGNYFDSWTVHTSGGAESIGWLNALLLRDAFARLSHRAMNRHALQDRWVHLYLNGLYWGVYNCTERPDEGFAAQYYGGEGDDYDVLKQRPRGTANGSSPEVVHGDLVAWNALMDLVKGDTTDPAVYAQVTVALDVDAFIDYIILNLWGGNQDWPHNNWYATRNKRVGGRWQFIEWDAENFMFKLNEAGKLNTAVDNSPGIIYSQLRQNAEFRLRFADRLHRHLFHDGALAYAACSNRLAEIAGGVRSAMNAESARWGDERGQDPPMNTIDNWDVVVADKLQRYCRERGGIVLNQFRGVGLYPDVAAPAVSPHGGAIAAGDPVSVAGDGVVYYTLDGSDPREAVTGAALGMLYTGAVSLARSVVLKARVLDGAAWSAVTEARFVLDEPSSLRITEIMYHPAPPTPGTSETNYLTSDFEFVEVRNTGSVTAGLAGTQCDAGILFDFTSSTRATLGPGEFALVVKNRAAFAARYPGVPAGRVVGEFEGEYGVFEPRNLDDGGERVRLRDGLGRTVLSFEYDDWYAATDGGGYSLVPVNVLAAEERWDEHVSWHISSQSGGSPGVADGAAYPVPGSIVINEVLTHQDVDNPGDWIELHNTSTQSVDIGGWFLSDDLSELKKYVIPSNTMIVSGGFAVFTEFTHFGTNVLGPTNGFALDEHGESIYLGIPAADGSPATVTDSRRFGASDNGVTIGRHVLSTGSEDLTALAGQTPGGGNGYPLVGPVVIGEIMYHPASSDSYEYVELRNGGGSDVSLFDVQHGGWELGGAVDYTFTAGEGIAAGGYALAISTNEAAFRVVYTNIPPDVPLYGPYAGRLANGGETLELRRPGAPDPVTGRSSMIVADRVQYRDTAPWPAGPDGGGPALERRHLALYGNDPANWLAGFPGGSPGGAQPRVVVADVGGTVNGAEAVLHVAADTVWSDGAVTDVALLKDGEVVRTAVAPDAPLVWTGVVSGVSATFQFRITDDGGEHLSPPATLVFPLVDAGPDQVVRSGDSVRLAAGVTVDGAPWQAESVMWEVVSGGEVDVVAMEPVTFASFAGDGEHVLRFSVAEGGFLFSDETTVTVLSSNAPNTLPYAETFEPYADGARLVGMRGWFGEASNAAVVTATSYVWSNEFPVAATHRQVVALDDVVSNVFENLEGFTNVWLDTMVECVYWREPGSPPVEADDQFSIHFNANGHPVVWHRLHPGSNAWTALPEVSVPEGDWMRLTIRADYAREPAACRLWINEAPVTNTRTWFAFAHTNAHHLRTIRNGGTFRMDDLVVDDYDVLSYRKVTASGEGGGTVSPGGEVLVPLHGDTNVVVAALPHYHVSDVLVDGESVGAVGAYTFTNVVSRRYLHAAFEPNLATNGVAEWWLAGHYPASSNFDAVALSDSDRDGLTAWEEWVAGTIPTNESSILALEIVRNSNGVDLSYAAVSGRTYRLRYRDAVAGPGRWQTLTSRVSHLTGRTETRDTTALPMRFYRLDVRK